jgi:5-methylcytosine-specific restriction endonuclease McrA
VFRKQDYPPDWPQIRAAILERAGNRCEGSPNWPHCRAANGQRHPETGSRVVLTIAHWPDPAKFNVDPANLHAWCQRCHLGMDRPYHLAVQRRNREQKRGQLRLFFLSEEEEFYRRAVKRPSEERR